MRNQARRMTTTVVAAANRRRARGVGAAARRADAVCTVHHGSRTDDQTSTGSGRRSTKPTMTFRRTWRGRRWRCGRVRTARCRRRRCWRSAPSAPCRRASAWSRATRFRIGLRRSTTKRENQENWLTRDPEIKCYLPGVPRATYMPYPFQIAAERERHLHCLRVRGRRARHPYEGSRTGASRFVDGTVGRPLGRRDAGRRRHRLQRPDVVRSRPATSTATRLHVVERYTRTSPDVIAYEATIEDPKVFTRPWKMSMPLYRRQERNAQLMDFKCVEFVEELMYGQWRKTPLESLDERPCGQRSIVRTKARRGPELCIDGSSWR